MRTSKLKRVSNKIGKMGLKTIGKKTIRFAVKTPSLPATFLVETVEKIVLHTTGSRTLARRAALFGQVVVCTPLGPLAVIGGVAKWKLDDIIDAL